MKKIILSILFVAVAAISNSTFARGGGDNNSFGQGKMVISAGYGFPWLAGTVLSTYNANTNFTSSSMGPIYIKGEYGVSDLIGIGLNVAYAKASLSYDDIYTGFDGNFNQVTYTDKWNLSYTTMSILMRMNFHFIHDNEKLDWYAGFGLGYRTGTWTESATSNNPSFTNSSVSTPNLIPFGFEMTTGIRYFFTPNVGAYAEAGIAKSPLQLGLCLKF